jgi:hypothetical protein
VTTQKGDRPGATVRAEGGSVTLRVAVQCTDWIDIDRVQVLVNGRAPAALNFTKATHPALFQKGVLKFERDIPVSLTEDAHLIVVACSEHSDLQTGYGSSSQSSNRPLAYHNPIFVDVDGNGFQPNGDLLGFPQSGKKVTLEEAKQFLAQPKRP